MRFNGTITRSTNVVSATYMWADAQAIAQLMVEADLQGRLAVPVSVELVGRGTLPRPAFKPERVVDE